MNLHKKNIICLFFICFPFFHPAVLLGSLTRPQVSPSQGLKPSSEESNNFLSNYKNFFSLSISRRNFWDRLSETKDKKLLSHRSLFSLSQKIQSQNCVQSLTHELCKVFFWLALQIQETFAFFVWLLAKKKFAQYWWKR